MKAPVVLVNFPYRLAELGPELYARKAVAVLTHDVISERVEKFVGKGWPIDFEPLTREQEAALIDRAKVAIAISNEDRQKLQALAPDVHVITGFPPMFEPDAVPARPKRQPGRLRCLFVGSGATHNRLTLDWLLKKAWPTGAEGIELQIVGSVGLALNQEELPPSIQVRGRVPDISAAYDEADLALALVLEGTGVKMKLLEAVRYGIPAITTVEGLRGLPGDAAGAFPIVSDGVSLASLLSQLSESTDSLDDMAARQLAWAREHLAPDVLTHDLMKELIH
ncbi:glycosyltransferase [Parasphingorhabdus sp.]|uniref:glycosyltransferase n=1 Tax=Parasphingorhabdus sp. TaxID=2709688 RepID=UPI003A947872